MTVFFWNKGTEEHKGFNVKVYYHPDCWVAQGLDYLRMNPYVPYIRDRTLELSIGEKVERTKILKRKASIDQRRRRLNGNYPDRALLEARLDTQVAELMMEIAPLGGIPKKWLQ